MDHLPSGQCLGSLAVAFATVITNGLTPNQISILGQFLDLLGDQVSLIGTINQIKCDNLSSQTSNNSDSCASSDKSAVADNSVESENIVKLPVKSNQSFIT